MSHPTRSETLVVRTSIRAGGRGMITNFVGRPLELRSVFCAAALMLTALVACVAPQAAAAAVRPGCITFDDLDRSAAYSPGQTFTSDGTTAEVVALSTDWQPGSTAGVAVSEEGAAGGSGLELEIENAAVEFNYESPESDLELSFGEYGGAVTLAVNGDLHTVEDFAELNGATIGGAGVEVTNGFGADAGQLRLSGQISSLLVGGARIWVDRICRGQCPGGAHFDDLAYGATYGVGKSFASNGVSVTPEVFHYVWGQWTSGGHARVDAAGNAGGTGHDVMANHVGLRFGFGGPVRGASFRFGEYGRINLEVNGDIAIADDLANLNGVVLGGVTVGVSNVSGARGKVNLTGTIDTLMVGGQELWLDDVCPGRPVKVRPRAGSGGSD